MAVLFRDGIISLNTRQFGTVVELIIRLLRGCQESGRLDFDLFDFGINGRLEVKSYRVYKKQNVKLDLDNLYNFITGNSNKNRLLYQSMSSEKKFDCNIQQIKPDLFDTLYYLLFFYDVIEIFRIEAGKIQRDTNLNYSGKQHRGNKGEGQFHITQKNYGYHKETYFLQAVSYEKIKDMLLKRRKTDTPP